jgi:CheY-like chemotaxis protein
MMPVMDGPELARAMREREQLRAIPVVVMTSLPGAVAPVADLYAAVLRKPFTPDELLNVVRRYC